MYQTLLVQSRVSVINNQQSLSSVQKRVQSVKREQCWMIWNMDSFHARFYEFWILKEARAKAEQAVFVICLPQGTKTINQ